MTQLRLAMFALFTVAAVSWTAVSALAFSQDSLSTGGAGSSTFADPDEQVNKAFGLENGAEPSGLSSVQSGPQQRKLEISLSTFRSTASLRLPILFPARATEPAFCRGCLGGCPSTSTRTSASVTSFMTSGMTRGRGNGRDQFAPGVLITGFQKGGRLQR